MTGFRQEWFLVGEPIQIRLRKEGKSELERKLGQIQKVSRESSSLPAV